MILKKALLATCLVVLAADTASAATLWGITGDGANVPESLFTISTVDASSTFQLALGNGEDGEGIAYNPHDGLLYHTSGDVDGEQYFETVDPTTLVVGPNLVPGSYGPPSANTAVTAIAWYPPLGTFLVSTLQTEMFHVTTDGTFTGVGATNLMRGFAVIGTRAFGIDPFGPFLYEVNPNDGSILNTLTMTLDGEPALSGNGLAVDADTGTVYAIMKVPQERILATLDLTTGAATSIGVLGDKFSGITFVPEPSGVILTGIGVLLLIRIRSQNTWR